MACDKRITLSDCAHRYSNTRIYVAKHGPLFETLKERCHPRCMDKDECILVKSDSTDWVGYLRISEIEIVVYKQTPCTSAILKFLGVKEWEESRYMEHCVDILDKNGWIVKEIDFVERTVGAFRQEARFRGPSIEYYMIHVAGHVLLMYKTGDTVCDTAPVERDRRRIYAVYSVTSKERLKYSSNLAYEMSKLNKMELTATSNKEEN